MAVFRPSLLKREKMPTEKRDLRRSPQINDLKIYARIPSERLSRRGYLPFAIYFLISVLSRGEKELAQHLDDAYHDALYTLP